MGNGVCKEKQGQVDLSQRGACINYMYQQYGAESLKDVGSWHEWTKGRKKEFPKDGTFDRNILETLREELEARDRQKLKVDWKPFYLWTMGNDKQFPRQGTFERSRLEELGQKIASQEDTEPNGRLAGILPLGC